MRKGSAPELRGIRFIEHLFVPGRLTHMHGDRQNLEARESRPTARRQNTGCSVAGPPND